MTSQHQCPLCQYPVPQSVVNGPPTAVVRCANCHVQLLWANGTIDLKKSESVPPKSARAGAPPASSGAAARRTQFMASRSSAAPASEKSSPAPEAGSARDGTPAPVRAKPPTATRTRPPRPPPSPKAAPPQATMALGSARPPAARKLEPRPEATPAPAAEKRPSVVSRVADVDLKNAPGPVIDPSGWFGQEPSNVEPSPLPPVPPPLAPPSAATAAAVAALTPTRSMGAPDPLDTTENDLPALQSLAAWSTSPPGALDQPARTGEAGAAQTQAHPETTDRVSAPGLAGRRRPLMLAGGVFAVLLVAGFVWALGRGRGADSQAGGRAREAETHGSSRSSVPSVPVASTRSEGAADRGRRVAAAQPAHGPAPQARSAPAAVAVVPAPP
ncbi:MAG TPA: hypothetical protein VKN99_27525, partial [Polyangia bacterium]|nr:hypothetical protein [Polyangia bacterium]